VFVLQQDEQRKDRQARDEAAMQAYLRRKATEEVQKTRDTNVEGRIQAYEGPVPSFLEEEYHYTRQASATFPEVITPSIQMSCIKDYQKSILEASRRLPCGLCGGLFQEEEVGQS
jgi:hypothetical protein